MQFTSRPIQFMFGRFVFSALVLIFLTYFSNAGADSLNLCTGEVLPPFQQTIHGPFSFPQVEMIARNHNIGLYQGGRIRLQPWIEVSSDAFLGVDEQGRVLNVVQLPERTIAFLLSGERKIKDIFFKPPADLFAIDTDGEILKFDRTDWDKSILPSLVKRAAANYLAATCGAAVVAMTFNLFGYAQWNPELLMATGIGSTSAALIEAYRAMVRYEKQNQSTDGFRSTGRRIEGFKRADYQFNESGQIADYQMQTRHDSFSLSQLIQEFVGPSLVPDFANKCEYELLARGIPPEVYEPQFK